MDKQELDIGQGGPIRILYTDSCASRLRVL
jgi:hypothetical protein